jgi:hypothetical protein
MALNNPKNAQRAIGKAPESLTLEEALALAGKFVALEIYSPAATPLKRIEAIGDSAADCVRQLHERGLDPAQFEFSLLPWPHA